MSISSEVRRAGPYSGNGSTTAFPFAFKVFLATQVRVVRTVAGAETTLAINTHYTVSLNSDQNANPGGTVNMLVAPPVGHSITLTSNVANLQPTVVTNLGAFYPEVVNDSLDRATIQIQQLDERVDRALVVPISSSGVDTQLPVPAAGALIGWDGSGTSLQNYNSVPIGGTIYQYVHRTIATAGQTAIVLPVPYTLGANALSVFINGLRVELGAGLDYVETNTTTITFNSALAAGDLVVVGIQTDVSATSPNFIQDIAALRLLNVTMAAEQVVLSRNHVAGDGGGVFRYDASDTTTADNGGTVIVDAAGRRWKRQYLEPANLRWWNAVGNGTTNNASAISQTEGLNELVDIPSGIYKTNSLATGAAVRGRYNGPGQIRTADNNNRAPIFRAITQAPGAFGNTTSVESAFNGDVSRVVFPIEYRITGAATAGQPTTGYLYTPELSEKFSFVYNESGHNQSTSTNVGRTGIVNSRVNLYHRGQGDLVAYNFSAFCDSTRAGSTHFLANPAIVGINGDMTAGANGVYLNPLEFHLDDATYDVAAIGAVYNLDRNNSTGAKSAFWTGVRVQSVGSQSINAGYSGVGNWMCGLNLAGVTFTAAKAAIVLAEGQRIYLEGSNSDPNGGDNGIVTGDTWIERSGSGFFNFVYDNTSALQVNTYWTNSVFRINTAEHYEIDGVTVIDGDKGIRFPSYAAADIAAVGNAVNTANKATGKAVWDTTNNRLMVASGSSAASPWYVCDGSASVTPS